MQGPGEGGRVSDDVVLGPKAEPQTVIPLPRTTPAPRVSRKAAAVVRDLHSLPKPMLAHSAPAAPSPALPPTNCAAERCRMRQLDWLKTNFFKIELGPGRCLRLFAGGPCECDLYLACSKSVTTPEYAPRLRARRGAGSRPRRVRTRLGPRGRTPPLHQRTYRKTPGRPQPADQRGSGGGRRQCVIAPWGIYRSGPCSSTWTVGSDKNTSASTGP